MLKSILQYALLMSPTPNSNLLFSQDSRVIGCSNIASGLFAKVVQAMGFRVSEILVMYF